MAPYTLPRLLLPLAADEPDPLPRLTHRRLLTLAEEAELDLTPAVRQSRFRLLEALRAHRDTAAFPVPPPDTVLDRTYRSDVEPELSAAVLAERHASIEERRKAAHTEFTEFITDVRRSHTRGRQ